MYNRGIREEGGIVRIRRVKTTHNQRYDQSLRHERLGGEKGVGAFLELFAGNPEKGGASLTTEMRIRGIRTLTPVGLAFGTEITEEWIRGTFRKLLRTGEVKYVWIAIPCNPHSRLSRIGKTSQETALRIKTQNAVQTKQMCQLVIPLMEVLHQAKKEWEIFDIWENPDKNLFWETPAWKAYSAKHHGGTIVTDYCTKGENVQKPMKVVVMNTNERGKRLVATLHEKGLGTRCDKKHKHEEQSIGQRGKDTEHYPGAISVAVAEAVEEINADIEEGKRAKRISRTGKVNNSRPMKHTTKWSLGIIDTGGHATCLWRAGVWVVKEHHKNFTTVGMGATKGTSAFEEVDVDVTSEVINEDGHREEVILHMYHVGVNDEEHECGIIDPYQLLGEVSPMVQADGSGGNMTLPRGIIIPFHREDGDVHLKYRATMESDRKSMRTIDVTPNAQHDRREIMRKRGETVPEQKVFFHSGEGNEERCQDPLTQRLSIKNRDWDSTGIMVGTAQPSSIRSATIGIHREGMVPTTRRVNGPTGDTGTRVAEATEIQFTPMRHVNYKEEYHENDGDEEEYATKITAAMEDLTLRHVTRNNAIMIDSDSTPTKVDLRGETNRKLERTSAGKIALEPRCFAHLSKTTLENMERYVTIHYQRNSMSAGGHQIKKALPGLANKRVNSQMSCDPVPLPHKSRTGMKYILVGVYRKSGLMLVEPMPNKSGNSIKYCLENWWRWHGTPTGLRTDGDVGETQGVTRALCRRYKVHQTQSEPYHQNQNPAEAHIKVLKRLAEKMVAISKHHHPDNIGILDDEWLDVYTHAARILEVFTPSHVYGRPSLEKHHGETLDVSHLNDFHWGQVVWVYTPKGNKSEWRQARYLGTAETIGNAFCVTVRLYDEATNKWNGPVISTSAVKSKPHGAGEDENPSVLDEDTPSSLDTQDAVYKAQFEENFLGNRNDEDNLHDEFVNDEFEEEEGRLPTITEEGESTDEDEIGNDGKLEDGAYRFKRIVGDKVSKNKQHIHLKFQWWGRDTNGAPHRDTLEPLFATDGIATQALENRDLGVEAARYILGKTNRRCKRATDWANQFLEDLDVGPDAEDPLPVSKVLKTRSKKRGGTTTYKFGRRVPRSFAEWKLHDEEYDEDERRSKEDPNYKTKWIHIVGKFRWRDAVGKEVVKFFAHNIGTDSDAAIRVVPKGESIPEEYQRIHSFFVFDVKPDGTFKARWVMGGNGVDASGVPSSMTVVTSRGVRVIFTQAAKDGQKVVSGDLGNAYLHGRTREKVWTTLGKEWGDQEGQRAIIVKAIYGLVSSAYEFHRYVSEAMRKMGWQPVEGPPNLPGNSILSH